MNIGLGLPITDPTALLDWARRGDAGPFSTLGLLDRLVYDNPEPLVTLAVLAGATTRIRLQTEVLLAPLREPALLAKHAATLDRLSGGRLVLGLGVGSRADDHLATGTDIRTRGRRLDEQMALMRRLWSGEPYDDHVGPIGPAPARPGGPEVLFGGFQPAALERVARWGDGFLAAAAPSWAGGLIDTVRAAWKDLGREGAPRIVAQVSTALGPPPVIDDARAAIAVTTSSPATPSPWSRACSPPRARSARRSRSSKTSASTRSCSTATAATPVRSTAWPRFSSRL